MTKLFDRSSVLWALAAVLLMSACGTTRIVGRVVDDEKKPVQAASVETDPPSDFIVTNHFGYFIIDRQLDATNTIQPLKPGSYKVVIKKLGYKRKTIPGVEIEDGAEFALGDVVLARKRIDMGDMEGIDALEGGGPRIDQLPPPVMGE
jgi:hypothetical protein